MPMNPNLSRSELFHEFQHGATYRKTLRKHGRRTANRQMQAAVLSTIRKGKGRKSWRKKKSRTLARRR